MSNELVEAQKPSLLEVFANDYKMKVGEVATFLTNTCFKTKEPITREQLQALVIVCNQYSLNPLLKQIYAFPHQGAIIPVVAIDGWIKIVNSKKEFDGASFLHSEKMIKKQDSVECPEWIECSIFHKDRKVPTVRRAYLNESHKPTGPWRSHTISMLENRAYIKCARFAFGVSGIYDEDDAKSILREDKPTTREIISEGIDINERLERLKKPVIVEAESIELVSNIE